MPDLKLKAAAEELAHKVPDYAGRSAFPPSAWWVAGDQLFVIGADGRKFAGALPPQTTAGRPAVHAKAAQSSQGEPTTPTRDTETPEHVPPPAKHKAGK